MNDQNLIRLTPSQARENGRKGGKASAKAKKEKKTLREMVKLINELSAGEKDKAELKKRGFADKDMTNQAVYAAAVLTHAIKGNGTAMRLWAELSGEKAQTEAGTTGGAACTVTFEFVDTALKDENEDNNT